jgi:hypothetical protein
MRGLHIDPGPLQSPASEIMKSLLLVTTALVFFSRASFPPAEADHVARTRLLHSSVVEFHPDVNSEFLCNYGFDLTAHYSASSGGTSSSWTHMAVPIVGNGQTVSRIFVKEGRGFRGGAGRFTVGIYSNTVSEVPGTLIAGNSRKADNKCSWIGVPIAPTSLKRGVKYWIEETALRRWEDKYYTVLWEPDPNAKYNAYAQTHWFSSVSSGLHKHSYTSPWTALSGGPYVRVR